MRYPRAVRDSLENIRDLPVTTPTGARIRLADVARIAIEDGPPMIKSENAKPTGYVFVDIEGVDIGGYVAEAQQYLEENLQLPSGYSLNWAGQYEYMERAKARLTLVIPFTLLIILLLLYLTFRNLAEPLLILASLPFALVGGVWFIWWLGHDVSVASGIGFIALAGVAAEFGVIMLIYLDESVKNARAVGKLNSVSDLQRAVHEGAVLRVRPKAMTVAVIVAGLIPLFIGHGTGSEVMQRIAAPMVGGMLTAPLLSMVILPGAYLLWQRWALRAELKLDSDETKALAR